MHITKNSNNLKRINVEHNFLKNCFILFVKSEWAKLGLKIRDLATLRFFKKQVLNFIRPRQKRVFNL